MASINALCTKCANIGAIVVRYRDGSQFDLALCDCRQGRGLRAFSDENIRDRFAAFHPETRIANVEDFQDASDKQEQDVTDAGRRSLRPRL